MHTAAINCLKYGKITQFYRTLNIH